MINVKNELEYLLVTDYLEKLADAGFMTKEELSAAKRMAWEKYAPKTVRE